MSAKDIKIKVQNRSTHRKDDKNLLMTLIVIIIFQLFTYGIIFFSQDLARDRIIQRYTHYA
jgi:hypothetical protein